MKKQEIIAVIPARGGSKDIPRKNVRLLARRPLLTYAIKNALDSKLITTAVVSTEDEEIAELARMYGIEVVQRPQELAQDETPLDSVVYHAVREMEKMKGRSYDLVITLQPTSPMLEASDIDRAIRMMNASPSTETLISAVPERHLYWKKEQGSFQPIHKKRVNRQDIDPIYKETGALFISRRKVVKPENRIGGKVSLFELLPEKSVDIDTKEDWMVAENLMQRRAIVFRVDGDRTIGTGHIYRALTLAQHIFQHEVFFAINEKKTMGIEKVDHYRYPVIRFRDERDFFEKIQKIQPIIVVNDILDTKKKYVQRLKKEGYFVVNFEDLGSGAEYADLLINELYESDRPNPNSYYGYRYACLRNEFFLFPVHSPRESVRHILVTFGGTDPKNLTKRTLGAFRALDVEGVTITVILGIGYTQEKSLEKYIKALQEKGAEVDVVQNVSMMAKHISKADIVITANGRTIYEVASFGIPCISISQSEREQKHLFVSFSGGVKDLGLGTVVAQKHITAAVKELMESYPLRKHMHESLIHFDLRGGVSRVLDLIFRMYNQRHSIVASL